MKALYPPQLASREFELATYSAQIIRKADQLNGRDLMKSAAEKLRPL